MAVGVIWLVLGLLYWTAILTGALMVFAHAPKGRLALREMGYFAAVGLVAAMPFRILKELLN